MSKRSSTGRASNTCWVCLMVVLITGQYFEDSPVWAQTETRSIAITNVTVHTMEREGVLERATVLVSGEQIVAVGKEVEIPEHATVVDATGWHLTPGLIDVRSRLFLGAGADDQASDGSLDAIDGWDRFDPVRAEVVASGVTTVYLQPRGNFGGFGAAVTTGAGTNDDRLVDSGVLNARAAAQMSLVGAAAETSRVRKQRYEALRKRLQEARDYQKVWEEYRAALAKQEAAPKEEAPTPTVDSPAANSPESRGSENPERPTEGPGRRRPSPPEGAAQVSGIDLVSPALAAGFQEPTPSPSPSPSPRRRPGAPQETTTPPAATAPETAAAATPALTPPKKPDFDALKERLLPVLDRKLPVRFEAQRAEEIQWALSLATEFNLRLVLEGLGEMNSATQLVQDSRYTVVLGPWLGFAGHTEHRQVVQQWSTAFAASTQAASVQADSIKNRVVIATFAESPMGSKWLRYHAAAAVGAGMSREQALRGITIEAATVAGIADRVGSIKVGKVADLVLFAGRPTDSKSTIAMVIQHGTPVVDRISDLRAAKANADLASSTSAVESNVVPAALPNDYAIVSQRVLLLDGNWQRAAVVVKDQRILAVTLPEEVPPGLPVYDVGACPVTPGLQSAWVVSSSSSDPISKESDAAQQFAADGFDPAAPQFRRMLESGLTSIHLVNAPTNVIAGQSVWLQLGELNTTILGRRKPAAEQWALSAAARNEERYPATLVGQIAMVRNRLAGQLVETTLYLPDAAIQKLLQQKVARSEAVQTGMLPVFVDARTDAEIEATMRLIAGTKVQAWLCRPNQLRPYSQRLAENQIGVVVMAADQRTHDWYYQDLVEAHSAGVRLLLGGEDGEALRVSASALVNAGLEPATGRRLLTMETARVLATGEPVGLVPGALANWLVWSDDPLDLSSQLLWHSRGQ